MTNPAPTSGEKFGVKFNVSQDIFDESVIYKNVRQEFVVTTSDKLKLNLIEYQKAIGARKDWLTPFGVFLSLLLTITTAEFKDTLNIGKETWKAFFLSY